jgi:hypothetical protein
MASTNKLQRIVLIALLMSATSLIASDYYKLQQVKRIDQNLYSAVSGTAKVLIETRYCYEYAVNSGAVLKYEPYSYDNKIIFDDDTSCDVAKVVAQ